MDRAAQRIVLTRNPNWWGSAAAAGLDHLPVLTTPRRHPGVAEQRDRRRRAGLAGRTAVALSAPPASRSGAPRAPAGTHFTFNGAPGSILADKKLRLAIIKGIDRQAIADVTPARPGRQPDAAEQPHLRRRAGGLPEQQRLVAFNPEQASRSWTRWAGSSTGPFREKDGKQLVDPRRALRLASTRQIAQVAQNSLAQIGVKLDIDAKGPATVSSPNYINVGDFDIAQFGWVGDAFPLSGLTQIYASDGESNFGKIGNAEIDAKIEQTLAELDPDKARGLANEVDKMIWAGRLQPAAGPVARQHRGAKHSGELRRRRPGRPGLQRDRVHEVAATRCTIRGTKRGSTLSIAAAAPITVTIKRSAGPLGSASSAAARADSVPIRLAETAFAICSAARSRMSSSAVAGRRQPHQHRARHQRRDPVSHRGRRGQIAPAGNDYRRPDELRHLGDQIVGFALERHRVGSEIAVRGRRVQRLAVRDVAVVQFAEADPADEVGLVAVRSFSCDQQPGEAVHQRPQPVACPPTADRVDGSAVPGRRSRTRRPRVDAAAGVSTPPRPVGGPSALNRLSPRRSVPQHSPDRNAHDVDVAGRQHR